MLPPPTTRQTLLFSATFPGELQELTRSALRPSYEMVHLHPTPTCTLSPTLTCTLSPTLSVALTFALVFTLSLTLALTLALTLSLTLAPG